MTDLLRALADEREVLVRTQDEDGRTHRAIIWVVVDDAARILVRSYRGAGARWYREAISGRPVALVVGDEEHPVSVEHATDPDRVTACTAGLEAKYAGDPATPAMVRPEVLDTTLELRLTSSLG